MKMNMKDCLSGFAAVVDDHPIAIIIEPARFSKRLRNKKQMPDELAIYVFDTVDVPDMLFRHYQDMDWRLRVDILECDSMLVFVDQFGGHFFFDDLAENTVWVVVHFSPPLFAWETSEETALFTGVTCWPSLVHFDEQRVLVAVIQDVLYLLDMTGRLPFLPELLPRTAPEPGESRLNGLFYGRRVHVGNHEHFTTLPILDYSGNQALFIIFEVRRNFHAGLLS
jgi:hypothetical protein